MAEPARVLEALAPVLDHPALVRFQVPEGLPDRDPAWSQAALAGRLCELGPGAAPAVLSVAASLVCDAQRTGEPAAWVTSGSGLFYPPDSFYPPESFYPPDMAASGVDLAALPVVRARDAAAAGRAADLLLRSGAFGLVVVDLVQRTGRGRAVELALPLQSRLVQLARKHDAVVLCLTDTPADRPSLGSLVSMRALASRRRVGRGRYVCEVTAVKDKRHGPGWRWQGVWRGPDGLG